MDVKALRKLRHAYQIPVQKYIRMCTHAHEDMEAFLI